MFSFMLRYPLSGSHPAFTVRRRSLRHSRIDISGSGISDRRKTDVKRCIFKCFIIPCIELLFYRYAQRRGFRRVRVVVCNSALLLAAVISRFRHSAFYSLPGLILCAVLRAADSPVVCSFFFYFILCARRQILYQYTLPGLESQCSLSVSVKCYGLLFVICT